MYTHEYMRMQICEPHTRSCIDAYSVAYLRTHTHAVTCVQVHAHSCIYPRARTLEHAHSRMHTFALTLLHARLPRRFNNSLSYTRTRACPLVHSYARTLVHTLTHTRACTLANALPCTRTLIHTHLNIQIYACALVHALSRSKIRASAHMHGQL